MSFHVYLFCVVAAIFLVETLADALKGNCFAGGEIPFLENLLPSFCGHNCLVNVILVGNVSKDVFCLGGFYLKTPLPRHVEEGVAEETTTTTGKSLVAESSTCLVLFASRYEALMERLESAVRSRKKWLPRNNFVVVFLSASKDRGSVFRLVLENMWVKFQVLNVVILSAECGSCSVLADDVAYAFDPFAPGDDIDPGDVVEISAANASLIRNLLSFRLKNLRRYPLRVSMFYRTSTARPLLADGSPWLGNGDVVRYEGVDAVILQNLARYMNFSVSMVLPTDGDRYGGKLWNGTFTGALGDVVNGRADIAFNSMFCKDYETEEIDFITPFEQDSVCILVPKNGLISKIHLLTFIFTPSLQLTFALVYAGVAVLWIVVTRLEVCLKLRSDGGYGVVFIFMQSVHLLTSGAVNVYLRTTPERTLILTTLLFFVVISSILQGKMVTVIRNPVYYPDIRTLKELDESGLPISTSSLSLANVLGSPEDTQTSNSTIDNLIYKIKVLDERSVLRAIEHTAYFRNTAAIARESEQDFGYFDEYRDPADGSWLVHMVDECPRVFLVAFVVPRGSPYLFTINRFFSRAVEGGLIQKWDTQEYISLMMSKGKDHVRSHHKMTSEGHGGTNKPFTLNDMQLSFAILVVGTLSSLVTFLCEVSSKSYLKACK